MSSIRVGFIGLGSMGIHMARSIAQSRLPLTVYDLRKEPLEEMRALGATVAGWCREVAAASDAVISMVRDIPETEEAGANVPVSKFIDELDIRSVYDGYSTRMRR